MLKQPSTEAYNTYHKYDFICISESYLDSTVDADNKNVVHADYPSNLKKGGVCVYYK